MIPLRQHLTGSSTHLLPSFLVPCAQFSKSSLSLPIQLNPLRRRGFSIGERLRLRCLGSLVSEPKTTTTTTTTTDSDGSKPLPSEVSRTVMELCSVGTLSTLTEEGWPLGIGVRFAVDSQGTPVLCFNNASSSSSSPNFSKSALHVQLEQCGGGGRTPQCTIQGTLHKPQDRMLLKKLQSIWNKKFEEEVDEDLLYVVAVERVLQIDDFMEEGTWVDPSDYKAANPDPLRDFAEKILEEINTHNMEDVRRFCNVFADLDFQVSEAKVVWVDRLGFDMRVITNTSSSSSSEREVYELRIPFPREVNDEKSAKSSFNCMSQLAWEVEKNYALPDFNKVKHFKRITTTSPPAAGN